MPLSKERNRERMRQARTVQPAVQPIIVSSSVQPNDDIPWYNPTVHRSGDKVKVQSGRGYVVTTIPELDADGHPVPVW